MGRDRPMQAPGSLGRTAGRMRVMGPLVFITAMAAAVRLVGIDTLLPHATEPDALMVMQAAALHEGSLDPDGGLARKYPLLLAQLISPVMPRPSAAVSSDRGDPGPPAGAGRDLAHQLAAARLPYVRVRIAVALLSLLMVPLTWLFIRSFLGDPGALFAAALVGMSLLHVLNAQQARPHAPAATFMLLALIAVLAMSRSPNWRTHLLAGVACGAAIASLQSGLFILPAFAAAYLLRRRGDEPLIDGWLALPVAVIAAFVIAYYPLVGNSSALFRVGGLQFGFRDWNGGGFPKLPVFLWRHDPVLLALAVVGLLHLAITGRRRLDPDLRRDLLVLASFALPYAIVIGVYDVTQSRYVLPLLPLVAGLAASGASLLVRVSSRFTGSPRLTAGFVTVLLLALPVYASTRLAALHAGEDTLTAAARWIDEHLEPLDTTLVISPDLDLPVFYASPAIRGVAWGTAWSRYQTDVERPPDAADVWTIDPLLEIDEDGAVRPVLTTRGFQQFLGSRGSGYMILGPGKAVRIRKQLAPLKRWLTEVTRFDALRPRPGSDGTPNPPRQAAAKGYQDERMLERALEGVRWGPPLRIYRFEFPPDGEAVRQR